MGNMEANCVTSPVLPPEASLRVSAWDSTVEDVESCLGITLEEDTQVKNQYYANNVSLGSLPGKHEVLMVTDREGRVINLAYFIHLVVYDAEEDQIVAAVQSEIESVYSDRAVCIIDSPEQIQEARDAATSNGFSRTAVGLGANFEEGGAVSFIYGTASPALDYAKAWEIDGESMVAVTVGENQSGFRFMLVNYNNYDKLIAYMGLSQGETEFDHKGYFDLPDGIHWKDDSATVQAALGEGNYEIETDGSIVISREGPEGNAFALELQFTDNSLTGCITFSNMDYESFRSLAVSEFGMPMQENTEEILEEFERGALWVNDSQFVMLVDVGEMCVIYLMPIG